MMTKPPSNQGSRLGNGMSQGVGSGISHVVHTHINIPKKTVMGFRL